MCQPLRPKFRRSSRPVLQRPSIQILSGGTASTRMSSLTAQQARKRHPQGTARHRRFVVWTWGATTTLLGALCNGRTRQLNPSLPTPLHIDCTGTAEATRVLPRRRWDLAASVHTSEAGFWLPKRSPHWRSRAQTDVHGAERTKRQILGNDFATGSQNAHMPLMRVSHTAAGSKSLAQKAARWAAKAHVTLRHRWWRGTTDNE